MTTIDGSVAMHASVDSAMSALGGLDSQGFLNLLVAQLKYQSPLQPSDPGDLMTQTSALAQLDATQQLLTVQQQSLGLRQAATAASLVGRSISATDVDGVAIEGVVDVVRYTSAGPVLEVSGQEVLFSAVGEIRAAETDTTETTT